MDEPGFRIRLHAYVVSEIHKERTSSTPHEGRKIALGLFNRFYCQLRYGCTNPACNTPTCLSCQKRCAKAPFRRLTVFSARALASFLASEENAVQKLCPHPAAEVAEVALPRDELLNLPLLKELQEVCRQTVHETFVASQPKPTPVAAAAEHSKQTQLRNQADIAHVSTTETNSVKRCCFVCRGVDECEQNGKEGPKGAGSQKQPTVPHMHDECLKEKDPKSLSQNVFDTQMFKLSGVVDYKEGSYRLQGRDGSFSIFATRSQMGARFRRVLHNEHKLHPIYTTLWSLLDYAYPRTADPNHTAASELEQAEGAAEVVNYTLTALDRSLCALRDLSQSEWQAFVRLHQSGQLVPSRKETRRLTAIAIKFMDHFEDELALRLIVKLARVYAARLCWSEASNSRDTQVKQPASAAATGFSRFVRDIMMDIAKVGSTVPGLVGSASHRASSGHEAGNAQLPEQLQVSDRISYADITLEWLRSVILHEWDGKATVDKYGAVGGAIQLISNLCMSHLTLLEALKLMRSCYADDWREHFHLSSEVFCMPFLADQLDSMGVPVEWASWQPSKSTTHLLSFPFLFEPATLVTYFRAINYDSMVKKFEDAFATAQLIARMVQVAGDSQEHVHNRLKIATSHCLVLDIRRGSILKDAMDQLWRRQKRELLRPLKVRMGMDEGEEGVDHGGVQQEFFRLAFSEALDSDYGMFITEPQTRMSWFQACTLEPSYRFELLGLLASLAVYNGLTLPITFPLALYRKLLGHPVTDLKHIQDGWPDLAKGLSDLLTWSDGDVADVFMRSYVYSVGTADGVIHIDMERCRDRTVLPPELRKDQTDFLAPFHRSPALSNGSTDDWVSLHNSDPPLSDSDSTDIASANERTAHEALLPQAVNNIDEAVIVTNKNREKYVADYISWLTEKSILRQYEAFARGFYQCFDRKALSIFSPEALRNVVEGSQDIDLEQLEMVTKYENGFSFQHRVIREFWQVVRGFSKEQVRKLLEFVTASDRIPVKGVSSILFVIQRNGNNDERLPTSLTCFGRLLLPEYSSEKKLQKRLCLAIENSRGFGVA